MNCSFIDIIFLFIGNMYYIGFEFLYFVVERDIKGRGGGGGETTSGIGGVSKNISGIWLVKIEELKKNIIALLKPFLCIIFTAR